MGRSRRRDRDRNLRRIRLRVRNRLLRPAGPAGISSHHPGGGWAVRLGGGVGPGGRRVRVGSVVGGRRRRRAAGSAAGMAPHVRGRRRGAHPVGGVAVGGGAAAVGVGSVGVTVRRGWGRPPRGVVAAAHH